MQDLIKASVKKIDSPIVLKNVIFQLNVNSNPEAIEHLELKALELMDSFQPNHLYSFLYFLARHQSNRRVHNSKLMFELKKKLLSRPINFDRIKLKNLFYACSVLKVNDERLLTALSENLIDTLLNDDYSVEDRKSVMLPVLMSCFKLGWNHTELTGLLMKTVETLIEDLSPAERVALLSGIGKLKVEESEKLVMKLRSDMTTIKTSDPELYIETVKAFSVLRKADQHMVQEVLSEGFYGKLLNKLSGKCFKVCNLFQNQPKIKLA